MEYLIYQHRIKCNIVSNQGTNFTSKEIQEQTCNHGVHWWWHRPPLLSLLTWLRIRRMGTASVSAWRQYFMRIGFHLLVNQGPYVFQHAWYPGDIWYSFPQVCQQMDKGSNSGLRRDGDLKLRWVMPPGNPPRLPGGFILIYYLRRRTI